MNMHQNKMHTVVASGLIIIIFWLSPVSTHKECGLLDKSNENIIPWVVNIYQSNEGGSYEFICSGTVVARKIILTAASCFYDDIVRELRNKTFAITAGQRHREWNSNENQNVQIREISRDNIFAANQYKGVLDNYSYNIAIVKLNADQKFDKNSIVKKACVHWDNDFIESELETNSPQLKFAAWDDNTNPTLTSLEPLYINYDVCYSLLPINFQAFLTFDKMCAKVEDLHHTVVSTGSGLYTLNSVKNRWYLIGIASEITSVDSKTYITFIKLKPHLNWISNTAFLHIDQ